MAISTTCKVDWTDSQLTIQSKVRYIHIDELRQVLNRERTRRQLSAVSFTDPQLSTSKKIRMIHIEELRQKIEETPKKVICTNYHVHKHEHLNAADETSHLNVHNDNRHSSVRSTHNYGYLNSYDYCHQHYHSDHGNHYSSDQSYHYTSEREFEKIHVDCEVKGTVYDHRHTNYESGHNTFDRTSEHTQQKSNDKTKNLIEVVGSYQGSVDFWHGRTYCLDVANHFTTSVNYSTGSLSYNPSDAVTCSSVNSIRSYNVCQHEQIQTHCNVLGDYTWDFLNIPENITFCSMRCPSYRNWVYLSADIGDYTSYRSDLQSSELATDESTYNSVYRDTFENYVNDCKGYCDSARTLVFRSAQSSRYARDYSSRQALHYVYNDCEEEVSCYQAASPGYLC